MGYSIVQQNIVLTLLFSFFLQNSHSINLENAVEGLSCFEPETVRTSITWMMSVNEWYYIAMSRLDLYASSLDVTRKAPEEMQEHQFYYDSCLNWTVNPISFSFTVNGYGRQRFYKFQPLDLWFSKVQFAAEDGGLPGIAYTTLTDDKAFTFSAICLTELNQMTWAVASPFKTLPDETLKIIHEHAESLGYKKEYFTAQKYDHCGGSDKTAAITKVNESLKCEL